MMHGNWKNSSTLILDRKKPRQKSLDRKKNTHQKRCFWWAPKKKRPPSPTEDGTLTGFMPNDQRSPTLSFYLNTLEAHSRSDYYDLLTFKVDLITRGVFFKVICFLFGASFFLVEGFLYWFYKFKPLVKFFQKMLILFTPF